MAAQTSDSRTKAGKTKSGKTRAGKNRAGATKAGGADGQTKAGQSGTSRASPAAHRAVAENTVQATLPFFGRVCLPAPQRLAWYAGIGVMATIGLMEWPVAVAIAIGHLLSEDHHNRLIESFGSALEEA